MRKLQTVRACQPKKVLCAALKPHPSRVLCQGVFEGIFCMTGMKSAVSFGRVTM